MADFGFAPICPVVWRQAMSTIQQSCILLGSGMFSV
jgi:hypothetical protein